MREQTLISKSTQYADLLPGTQMVADCGSQKSLRRSGGLSKTV